MKTMTLFIKMEYELPNESISVDDLEEIHQKVFEDEPSDFIKYVLSKDSSSMEYEFTLGKPNSKTSMDFDCENYFYNSGGNGSLCLRYGALCGNILCKESK